VINRIRHGSLRSGAHSHASDIEHIGHRPNLVQGAGELGRTLQLDPQIDAGRFGRAGAHAGITHIDAVVRQPPQDVLEHDRYPVAWEQLFGSLQGLGLISSEDRRHRNALG
jgi:hypothetical protein